jgi:hypothetical protein
MTPKLKGRFRALYPGDSLHHHRFQLNSAELLRALAEDDGGSVVDQLGAPHTKLKHRIVTVKRADGGVVAVLDEAGTSLLDDFIRRRLVYEAVPLDAEYQRVYRLTPAGREHAGAVR